ncbi:MAG: sulfatase-like hydrolase/transferase, partial [Candidatus Latescibacteria bacterium]|nr:sulfatase-like hydrolase/transferase [Candidatus Latescibacterota bacterium]
MASQQPNVIVFLTDDQGYGDLSIFGNPDLQTPNIDRIGHEGVCLMQHYSGSPICAPARATFLTGRYNHRVGALSVESNRGLDRIALRESTIADLFKQGGYKTGMTGKWHNGLHDMRYHPNNRGFDEFAGFMNGGMNYWDWIIEYNGQPKWADGRYLTDVFTDDAIDFIERHKTEPFFLYIAYNAPHGPLEAPEEDIQPFADLNKYTRAVCQTYGMIRRMDTGIDRILDALEKNNLDENTIILYTSDNGPVHLGKGENDQTRYNGPFRGMKYDVL